MDLCFGKILGNEVVCPLHGWKYDVNGKITTIRNDELVDFIHPNLLIEEKYNLIWIKNINGISTLPDLEFESKGYLLSCIGKYFMETPLIPTVDHFLKSTIHH